MNNEVSRFRGPLRSRLVKKPRVTELYRLRRENANLRRKNENLSANYDKLMKELMRLESDMDRLLNVTNCELQAIIYQKLRMQRRGYIFDFKADI